MDLAGSRGKDFSAECLIPTLTSAAAAAAAALEGARTIMRKLREVTEEQEMEGRGGGG